MATHPPDKQVYMHIYILHYTHAHKHFYLHGCIALHSMHWTQGGVLFQEMQRMLCMTSEGELLWFKIGTSCFEVSMIPTR